MIAHPGAQLATPELIAVVSGPALYLLGHVALRLRMARTVSTRRLAGALACVVIGVVFASAAALVVAALLFAVLVAVIASDQRAAVRRRRRGEPSPLERMGTA